MLLVRHYLGKFRKQWDNLLHRSLFSPTNRKSLVTWSKGILGGKKKLLTVEHRRE